MKLQYKLLLVLLLTFLLFLVVNTNATWGMQKYGHGDRFKFMEQLSEEQDDAVKAKIKELKEAGANREEIHAEVKKMLVEYGIKVPEHWNELSRKNGHRPGREFRMFFDQLTEEQRTTLHEKIKSMHEDGATREEIYTEIVKMLEEYGIDEPDDFVQRNTMWNKLNDEQRNAIRAKKREMRKEGASREEIKKEIEKMIQSFGVNESEDQTETGVETAGESLSIRSYPNPFNPETTIEYQLNTSAQVSINIYDIQGQLVKSLGQSYRQAGTYNTKWNGLTESGYQVPSGIYFIRITAGSETLNHRIVMMK